MIRVQCPHCDTLNDAPDVSAGNLITCVGCSQVIPVRRPPSPPPVATESPDLAPLVRCARFIAFLLGMVASLTMPYYIFGVLFVQKSGEWNELVTWTSRAIVFLVFAFITCWVAFTSKRVV